MQNKQNDYKIKKTPNILRPYYFIKPSVSEVYIRILVILFIQILMLCFTHTYSALVIIFSTVFGALLANLYNIINKKVPFFSVIPIIIQGIFIGMLLPQTFPPFIAFFISFIVLLIEHLVFSDNSKSWCNAVCIAVIFAWFIGTSFFPKLLVTNDIVTLKNPLAYLIKIGDLQVFNFDSSICQFLNSTVLYWFNVTLPEGIISFLWDNQSIIPAFRFSFLTLIASILLFADNGLSPMISSVFLLIYGLLIRTILPLINNAPLFQGDLILAFCNSGVIFCSVFLIQWFGTSPTTVIGKFIYGFLSGVIAFFVIGYGTSSIGICYVVIFANIINLLIRFFEDKFNEKKLKLLFLNSKELIEETK